MDTVVAKERYGSEEHRRSFIRRTNDQLETFDRSEKYMSVSHFFKTVFLPQGYPESVSDDYFTYQLWDTVQAFASSITGTLATQAVLKGIGVGDETATPMAATITWILKDGTGMIGRIAFAWYQGTGLDCDAKRWRLFADLLNDFAIFLEILAPFFKVYFTFIVCVSGVGKSIVGVAGGATRAALTQHQARRNNMADVSAKDGSQETLVNLAALICSLLIIPVVSENQFLIWILFVLFTSLHIFANYSAVTSVVMETINQARLNILVHHYLKCGGAILSVKKVNKKEPVVIATKRRCSIQLGARFHTVIKNFEDLWSLQNIFTEEKYIINIDLKSGVIGILLHEESKIEDHIKCCFQAEILNFAAEYGTSNYDLEMLKNPNLQGMIKAASLGDRISLLENSLQFTNQHYNNFVKALTAEGWTMCPSLMGADEWRSAWSIHGLPEHDKKSF